MKRFDITFETLGRGSFGVVKKGKSKKTGQEVAIKVIPKTRKMPIDEVEAMKSLSGVKHVIPIYWFDQDCNSW